MQLQKTFRRLENMFGMGPMETVLIIGLIVVLFLIFGPKQLPKLGKMFGKTMKSVRKGIDEVTDEMKGDEEAAPAAEPVVVAEPAPVAAAPVAQPEIVVEAAPAVAAPIKCPKCGTVAPAGTKFCPECGTSLTA
jgi:sec-independent protein translocase protein TatA